MKLMQLNIWGGRLLGNAIELIQKAQPDIINLQEVFSSNKHVGLLLGTLEEMQRSIDYPNVFYSPVFEFPVMNSTTQFGNCILSKLPFASTEAIFTNLDFTSNFSFDDNDYNVRNLQHVTVEHGGKKINVLNHHGHHVPEHKNGDDVTLRQMKQIAAYIKDLDGPVILSGDFNLAPHSESLEQINSVLKNLSIKHKLTTTRTSLTHKKEVCDYIFVNDEVKVKDFYASDEVVSDHQALVLEFDV